jgi:hypothetical protein
LDSFLALERAFAAFFFLTFDACFLRLAMADPLAGARKRTDARSQKTAGPESRQLGLRGYQQAFSATFDARQNRNEWIFRIAACSLATFS